MALGMMLHLMLMQCEEPLLPGSGWGSPGCRRLQTSLCGRYNGAEAPAQSSPWRELRELVAYLSMTQAAKFCGWIGPSESRKTLKLSLIYLLKMLCNSAKRRLCLTPNMSNLTHPHLLQSLPVLCVWHAYSTDSTYTHQKCSLAPFGIQPSEIESPDHFSSVWRALVGTREMIWQLYPTVAHVSSAGDVSHRNWTIRAGKRGILAQIPFAFGAFPKTLKKEPWPEHLCVIIYQASWQRWSEPHILGSVCLTYDFP